VSVYDNPLAKITIDDSTVCLGVPINLSDASTAGVSAPITSTSWDLNSDGSVDNTNTTFSYTYPTPNRYKITLIVKDQNGCSDTAYQSVLVHRLPIADFSVNAGCLNLPSDFTSTTVLGDAPISSFDWVFPGPAAQSGNPTSFVFTQGGDQPVSLSVTDNNGCTDSIIKTVFINTTALNLTTKDTTICLGSSVGISAQGQFDNISWTPSTWVDNPNAASVIITPLSSIRYVVRASSGACPSFTDTVKITVIKAPEISVTATPQEIILGLSSNITSEILGKKDSIVWSPNTALSCRNCPNPTATPKETTTYTATVYYGKDGIVCSNVASVTITVIQSCDGETVYIPNTFSPNADGNNDRFIIRGLGITKINHFRVFDRWGKVVFEANNVSSKSDDASWNGGLKNDLGKPENPGVFVYEFEVECITGEKIPGKGNITLIR
jgi:gliding motility-associated-like protein